MKKSTQNAPTSNISIFQNDVAALTKQDQALTKTTGLQAGLMFTTTLSGAFVAQEKFPNNEPTKDEKIGFNKEFLPSGKKDGKQIGLSTRTKKDVSRHIFKLVENHSEMIKSCANVAELRKAIAEKFATTKTKTVDGEEVETEEPCDGIRKLDKALNPKADKTKNEDSQISNNEEVARLKKFIIKVSKLSDENFSELELIVNKMSETTDNPVVPLSVAEAFKTDLNKPLISILKGVKNDDNETSLEVA
tara:strand:- start:38 stop:781 length:744 start_codon:yes stop_codon:yes gene_type:complete